MNFLRATFLIWLVAVFGMCQMHAQTASSTIFESLRQIQSLPAMNSANLRSQLATRLDLNIPGWTRESAAKDIPCTFFDSVTTYRAKLSANVNGAVLDIYSSSCGYTFISAFRHRAKDGWEFLDTLPLRSFDGPLRISMESLIHGGTEEIIVNGVLADNGTGVFQTNYVVLKLFGKCLRVILDVPEDMRYNPAPSRYPSQREHSSFTIVNSVSGGVNSSIRNILQKQVLQSDGRSITRWWLYIWMPELGTFQAVSASPPEAPTHPSSR